MNEHVCCLLFLEEKALHQHWFSERAASKRAGWVWRIPNNSIIIYGWLSWLICIPLYLVTVSEMCPPAHSSIHRSNFAHFSTGNVNSGESLCGILPSNTLRGPKSTDNNVHHSQRESHFTHKIDLWSTTRRRAPATAPQLHNRPSRNSWTSNQIHRSLIQSTRLIHAIKTEHSFRFLFTSFFDLISIYFSFVRQNRIR